MIVFKGEKQSGETMDFDVPYADWFSTRSDTPASVTGSVLPATATLVSTTLNIPTKTVKCILSGGVVGTTYTITVRLTTSSSIIKEDELQVTIKDYP